MSGNLRRVSKRNPCPVCCKATWCGMSADGALCICMRVESNKSSRNGGFVHLLREPDRLRGPRIRRVTVPTRTQPATDFGQLAAKYAARANARDIEAHAMTLGVSADALLRLGVGWDGVAWTFPMRDETGRAVGIRRRFPNGKKLSVKGGHEGLFIPSGIAADATLVICEGPTDTAALLTIGLDAIGRPSCLGGVDTVEVFVRGRHVAIMADGDGPGLRGAHRLAVVLALACRSVRVACPPKGTEDARSWIQNGGTKDDVLRVIRATEPVTVKVGGKRD